MPITYSVDADRNLVRSIATGVVTNADFRGWTEAIAADAEVSPGMDLLADFREVNRFDVSKACLRDVVQFEAQHERLSYRRRAFVVAQVDVYSLVRVYQALAETDERRLRVFRVSRAALQWLGLVGAEL